MAFKLEAKVASRPHNASHVHRHEKKLEEGGPRDQRYVKKLNEWLGIKPNISSAWQKLDGMLAGGFNVSRPRKKTEADGSPTKPVKAASGSVAGKINEPSSNSGVKTPSAIDAASGATPPSSQPNSHPKSKKWSLFK